MHNKHVTLGDIIKSAREQSNFTVEQLAEEVGISERYLYKIENEGKKPSYDVLYKLIRILSIPSDTIFYPEKCIVDAEKRALVHILSMCNEKQLETMKNMLNILIDCTQ